MPLYLALAACALAAASLIYRYDLYDREPKPLLALAVGLGAAAMAAAGRLESAAIGTRAGLGYGAGAAATAALVEESAKLGVVLAVALGARRHFNDPMDGLIYGSLAGLGAALEESLALLRQAAPAAIFLSGAEPVRLLGHLVMGGVGACGLGHAVLRVPGWRRTLPGCFLGALALHFLWDWIALWPAPAGGPRAWQAAGAIAVMLAGLLAYGGLVAISSRLSRLAFDPASQRGLWGWPFRRRPR